MLCLKQTVVGYGDESKGEEDDEEESEVYDEDDDDDNDAASDGDGENGTEKFYVKSVEISITCSICSLTLNIQNQSLNLSV